MITNKGKNLIAKYLIGQTPAYASYIALGCGANPQKETHTFTTNEVGTTGSAGFINQSALEFEMFRVPIISKGYIYENGISKIVFTAEMPTAERYGITEIGVYPALTNPSALRDSFEIFSFTSDEGWGIHSNSTNITSTAPTITDTIDLLVPSGFTKYFQTNVSNAGLTGDQRVSRQEQLRSSSNAIFLRGDFSSPFTYDGVSKPTVSTTANNYLTISNPNIDLSQNNPLDEIRLALSVISTDVTNGSLPVSINIAIELVDGSQKSAIVVNQITPANSNLTAGDYSSSTQGNRYVVSKIALGSSNFYKDTGFDTANIVEARIHANITDSAGQSSTNYWIGLDGLRLENLSDVNPLFALSAYTVLKNSLYANAGTIEYAAPAIKALNTSGLVEFKFSMDVI